MKVNMRYSKNMGNIILVEFLKEIYHKYSDMKIFSVLNDIYMNGSFTGNLLAALRVRKIARRGKLHELPIRVLFICQRTETWSKMCRVFERMLEDERFCAYVVALELPNEVGERKTYRYLEKLYGVYVIDGEDQKFDIRSWAPDYVFSNNPYDQYWPVCYRSKETSKYAKNCYIDYGYELSTTTLKVAFEKRYFRNVYLLFAENNFVADYNIKRFRRAHKKRERRTLNIGYPSFEYFFQQKTEKEDDKFTVVWTPRWTEDKNLGGSNFLNYKDKILQFSIKNDDLKLVFRPHPMTFAHFISIGKITEQEVEQYLSYFVDNRNREYDRKADYAETFWKSDVLLTDFSSIMIEYFLTGKPIIYCEGGAVLNSAVSRMQEGLYIVHSWEEVENILMQLSKGNDPLQEKRRALIEEVFGNNFTSISYNFLETILDDFDAK